MGGPHFRVLLGTSMNDELKAFARDLWWTTLGGAAEEFWRSINPVLWESSAHRPLAIVEAIGDESDSEPWTTEAHGLMAKRRAALLSPGRLGGDRVAYFCMEYGLHEGLPIYSGGLGILAGDHLRSASDLGVNLVAVGVFWRDGYFRQGIEDGQQVALYPRAPVDQLPLERVEDEAGKPIQVRVSMGEHELVAQAFAVRVGRVILYLLDADIEENRPEERVLTQRLYAGGTESRIRQEMLLGIGGVRLLEALGEDIDVFHMNEGHAAFLTLELWAHALADGMDPTYGWSTVRDRCVFTTHTPVPAGHDVFFEKAVASVFGPFCERAGISLTQLMDMGRMEAGNSSEALSMTLLAIRGSRAVNGVSALHGVVSREMWKGVPGTITHITNGVHPGAWLAPETANFLDAHLQDWRQYLEQADYWERLKEIPTAQWVELRDRRRLRLVKEVRRRLGADVLHEGALTIGFARRFATYKRAPLLFTNPDRLAAILDRGAQVVFAGKAHPEDKNGQEDMASILGWIEDPRFKGRIVFVPDYDMAVGRLLVGCTDIWLNNPRRPREASGTSGQKAAMNGIPNCSVLDGWWPEAYHEKNGWAIGDQRAWDDMNAQDSTDAASLYEVLESEILGLFSDHDGWADKMMESMKTTIHQFNSHRMVREYVERIYTS
jgi:starch phosphorylase